MAARIDDLTGKIEDCEQSIENKTNLDKQITNKFGQFIKNSYKNYIS